MRLDEPFPLNAAPSRLRNAILKEFKGRRSSIQEVIGTDCDNHVCDLDGFTPTATGNEPLPVGGGYGGPAEGWRLNENGMALDETNDHIAGREPIRFDPL